MYMHETYETNYLPQWKEVECTYSHLKVNVFLWVWGLSVLMNVCFVWVCARTPDDSSTTVRYAASITDILAGKGTEARQVCRQATTVEAEQKYCLLCFLSEPFCVPPSVHLLHLMQSVNWSRNFCCHWCLPSSLTPGVFGAELPEQKNNTTEVWLCQWIL